jgi:hypothetical protein
MPLLVDDELVRATEEDFRGQIPARFTAEGTINGDGLKRKLPDTGWDIAAATLAGYDE